MVAVEIEERVSEIVGDGGDGGVGDPEAALDGGRLRKEVGEPGQVKDYGGDVGHDDVFLEDFFAVMVDEVGEVGDPDEGNEIMGPHAECEEGAIDDPPAAFLGVDGELEDECGGEDDGGGHGVHAHFLAVTDKHGGEGHEQGGEDSGF